MLCIQVPAATRAQLVSYLCVLSSFRVAETTALNGLCDLERDGWVEKSKVYSRALDIIDRPFATYRKGGPNPAFAELPAKVRKRDAPLDGILPRKKLIYTAGPLGRKVFACARTNSRQLDHAVTITAAFLGCIRNRRHSHLSWSGEHFNNSPQGEAVPDVILRRPANGSVAGLIEIVTQSYRAKKLKRIHHNFLRKAKYYEFY